MKNRNTLLRPTTFKGIFATLTISLLATFASVGTGLVPFAQEVDAACPPLDTSKGVVTATVNIPQTGSYRVRSRIMAPNSTNNSYYLEVDDSTCGVVVGDSAITANSWQWIDYQNGSSGSKTTLNLTAGNHTIRMVGREDNVQVDRVLFLSDTTCIPSGTGSNCATTTNPIDTTPVYRLYSRDRGYHLYTTSASERDNAVDNLGYRYEGVAFDASLTSETGLIPVYRLYSRDRGYHLYTTSASERDNAVSKLNFRYEKVAYYAQSSGPVPIYRLYSLDRRYHFYTTSAAERDNAVSKLNFRYEGAKWFGVE